MDIATADNTGPFETCMMLDFIGKTMIATGVFKEYLDVLERLSEKEMILSIKPVSHVKKHLNKNFQGLKEKNPGDYILDRFSDRWNIEIISPKKRAKGADKELF